MQQERPSLSNPLAKLAGHGAAPPLYPLDLLPTLLYWIIQMKKTCYVIVLLVSYIFTGIIFTGNILNKHLFVGIFSSALLFRSVWVTLQEPNMVCGVSYNGCVTNWRNPKKRVLKKLIILGYPELCHIRLDFQLACTACSTSFKPSQTSALG